MRCEHPITVKGKIVPCGKCLSCRSANTNNWISRFMCESDAFKRGAFFGTLTYNNDALPEGGNLDEKAVALYWKRVKKELDLYSCGFVYTYCGEYGTRRGRPHYHFICAGACVEEGNVAMTQQVREVLENQWKKHNKGSFVYISEIRTPEASIRYLINYTNKTKGWYAIHPGESKSDFTKRTGLVAPFVRFSQGISKSYYEKNKDKLATADYLQFGKHKFCIPRYFRKKLEQDRTAEQHVVTLNKIVDFCIDDLKKKYKFTDIIDAPHDMNSVEFSPMEVCAWLRCFPVEQLAQVLSNYRKYCYELQRVKARYYVRWRKNYTNMDLGVSTYWAEYLEGRKNCDTSYIRDCDDVFDKYYCNIREFREVESMLVHWNFLQFNYRKLVKDRIIQAGINQKFKILCKVEKMYAKSAFLD